MFAVYRKVFTHRFRADKLVDTYEKDPEFQRFLAEVEAPVAKRLSAEAQLELIEKAAADAAGDYFQKSGDHMIDFYILTHFFSYSFLCSSCCGG